MEAESLEKQNSGPESRRLWLGSIKFWRETSEESLEESC